MVRLLLLSLMGLVDWSRASDVDGEPELEELCDEVMEID